MCANDHIDCTVTHAFDDYPDCFGCLETGQHFDADRPVCKAVFENLPVLLGEQCGWDQNGNLFAAVYSGKRRTQCDLGLAKADIASNNATHRLVGA